MPLMAQDPRLGVCSSCLATSLFVAVCINGIMPGDAQFALNKDRWVALPGHCQNSFELYAWSTSYFSHWCDKTPGRWNTAEETFILPLSLRGDMVHYGRMLGQQWECEEADHSHSGWVFPPSLNISGNTHTDIPRSKFPKRFQQWRSHHTWRMKGYQRHCTAAVATTASKPWRKLVAGVAQPLRPQRICCHCGEVMIDNWGVGQPPLQRQGHTGTQYQFHYVLNLATSNLDVRGWHALESAEPAL